MGGTTEIFLAVGLLNGTSVSILDAARLIKNALDCKLSGSELTDVQF